MKGYGCDANKGEWWIIDHVAGVNRHRMVLFKKSINSWYKHPDEKTRYVTEEGKNIELVERLYTESEMEQKSEKMKYSELQEK